METAIVKTWLTPAQAMAPMAVTTNLLGILNQDATTPQERIEVLESIYEFRAAYKQHKERYGADATMEFMFTLIDRMSAETAREIKVSCKKGCSHCCHVNVDTTQQEARMALKYAREHNVEIDLEALEVQQDLQIPDRPFSKFSACVFLGEDGACKIYPARPISCRKFLVQSEPKFCEVSVYKDEGVVQVVHHGSEMLTSAILNEEGGAEGGANFSKLLLELIRNENA